ncbi:MAG: hypothetical protein ACRCXZ_01130 [Patescibacteria group bacterium]
MNQTFAYKIGHNTELSINEFFTLTNDSSFTFNKNYIFSNIDLDIDKLGSIVFKAKIHNGYPPMPKKVGFVSTEKKGIVMNKLKALGAKKINLIEKLPNIGQVKYVKNWFIDHKDFVLEIIQYFNQELWSTLDMDLPAKDMKRGIINLKLARTMNNLTNLSRIHDPFAGLGRNAIASFDQDREFVLSDIDPSTEKLILDNLKFVQNFSTLKCKVNKVFIEDATFIKEEFDNDYAIVTEGYLTDSAHSELYLNQIESRLREIQDFWLNTLEKWSELNHLKEIIVTIPFFINNTKNHFWDIKKDLPNQFEHVPFFNSDYIFYKRSNTRIGHMIVRLAKK